MCLFLRNYSSLFIFLASLYSSTLFNYSTLLSYSSPLLLCSFSQVYTSLHTLLYFCYLLFIHLFCSSHLLCSARSALCLLYYSAISSLFCLSFSVIDINSGILAVCFHTVTFQYTKKLYSSSLNNTLHS